MDNLLYKGFVALDDLKNRDAKQTKVKNDYLMKKQGENLARPDDNEGKAKRFLSYNVFMPKRGELSATKILNDEHSLFNYLTSRDNIFFQGDNFEKKFLQELPRLLWQTEKMEDLGDYVLLFPNPDKYEVGKMNPNAENGISYAVLEEYFDDILNTTYNYPYKKQFMTALKQSFKRAFVDLNEFIPPKNSKKKGQPQAEANKKNKKLLTNNQPESNSNDGKIEEKKILDQGGDKPNENPGENEEQVKLNQKQDKDQLSSPAVQIKAIAPTPEYEKDAMNPTPEKKENDALDVEARDKKKKLEDEKLSFEKSLRKLRTVWGGGMYKPPGTVNNESDSGITFSQYRWDRNYEVKSTKDVMTLMRKTICTVLANQGFLMREIFVRDGDQIAVILTLPEANMRKIAEDMRMSKAVEFGLSDPLSLEPIDSKNRPLRTNILLKDEQQWERTYAKSENMHKTTAINAIRTDIVNLLKTDCNMKALVRLCDATWMENDQEHLIIDEDVPSLDQWKEYREYLKEIAMHLREIKLLKKKIMYIEEKFYGNTRFCVSGSKNRRSIDKMEIKKIVNRLVVKALIDTINKYDTLQNLWAALKMEVSAYSYQYETATNKMRPRNRDYFSQMWMDYMYHYPYTREEIDAIMDKDSLEDTKDKEDEDAGEDVGGVETVNPEDTKITIYNYEFNKIERLKIVYYLMTQLVDLEALALFNKNMEKILTQGFSKLFERLVNYALSIFTSSNEFFFPLHNRHQLINKDYHSIFAQLRNHKKIYNTLQNEKLFIQVQFDQTDLNADVPTAELTQHSRQETQMKSEIRNAAMKSQTRLDQPSKISNQSQFKNQSQLSGYHNSSHITLNERGLHQTVDGFRHNRSYFAEPLSRDHNMTIINRIKSQPKNQLDKELEAAIEIRKLETRMKIFLDYIEKNEKFENPYLKYLLDKQNGTLKKESADEHRFTMLVGEAAIETDLQRMHELSDKYAIANTKLISAVFQSLNTMANIREAVLCNFTKLNTLEFRNLTEVSLSYPVIGSFRNTLLENMKKFPESTVRNYFGEKVCLYYLFSNFYRDSMVPIFIFGSILMIFQMLFYLNIAGFAASPTTKAVFNAVSILFCICVVLWSKHFVQKWKACEKEFAIRYGLEGVEEKKTVRTHFTGSYKRNIVDDKVNSFEEDEPRIRRRFILTMIFLIFFCGITFISSFYLLVMKRREVNKASNKAAASENKSSSRLLQEARMKFTRKVRVARFKYRSRESTEVTDQEKLKEYAADLNFDYASGSHKRQLQGTVVIDPTDPGINVGSYDPSGAIPSTDPMSKVDCVANPSDPTCQQLENGFSWESGGSFFSNLSDFSDYDYNPYPETSDYEQSDFGGVDPDQFSDTNPYVPDTPDPDGGDFAKNLQNYFDPIELSFNIAEFIRILIYKGIFQKIITASINWQNLKYVEDVEKQLILTQSLYQLFNNAIMVIIVGIQAMTASEVIAYVDGELVSITLTSCINNECTEELSFFFLSYCLLQVVWALVHRVLYQFIVLWAVKKVRHLLKLQRRWNRKFKTPSMKEDNDKVPIKSSSKISTDPELKQNEIQAGNSTSAGGFGQGLKDFAIDAVGTRNQKMKYSVDRVINLFYRDPAKLYEGLDNEINHQVAKMDDFGDVNGCEESVNQYLPLYNSFSYSTLFGVIFPLSFLTCWAIAYIEGYVDKRALLHAKRRPIPKSVKSIGLWLHMIGIVTMLTIWTNSFYASFIIFASQSMAVKLGTFLSMSVALSILTYIYGKYDEGVSQSVLTLSKRAEFIKQFMFTRPKHKLIEAFNKKIATSFMTFASTTKKKKNVDFLAVAQEMQMDAKEAEVEAAESEIARVLAEKALMESPVDYSAKTLNQFTKGLTQNELIHMDGSQTPDHQPHEPKLMLSPSEIKLKAKHDEISPMLELSPNNSLLLPKQK